MAPTTSSQILLTGATGYVGGTILTQLLQSSSPALKSTTVICLLRGEDRAAILTSKYGDRIRPIVYKSNEDFEATTAAAAEADIVINAGAGYDLPSAQALLRGLAQRKAATEQDVWLIHLSGVSNLSDQPISQTWTHKDGVIREFDDAKDDVYEFEKAREALRPYPQRTTELSVTQLGSDLGVKTVIIVPSTIFGLGTGLFNRTSIQIPAYIKSFLKNGRAVIVGDGKTRWDHVHVEDLAELYEFVLLDILEGQGRKLPVGKQGVIFNGNGRHTWMELAQHAADACYARGKLSENRVHSVTLAEGGKIFTFGQGEAGEEMVEVAMSSNALTTATIAKNLGWKPSRGENAWKRSFADDLDAILAQEK